MTIMTEKENAMVRVVMDFIGSEKPTVAAVIRNLLSDYRRSFSTVKFQRDTTNHGGGFYTEFYIRESDLNRLKNLLAKAEA